jgi:DNA-binding response OmpR family regulator
VTTRQCLAVLVLEDDDDIRGTVVTDLAAEGFQVYQAASGDAARELLRRLPHPLLVLADLMMPGLNVWDLISALSEGDRLATLPVVAITSLDEIEGARRIRKPIDHHNLLKIVDDLCVRRT